MTSLQQDIAAIDDIYKKVLKKCSRVCQSAADGDLERARELEAYSTYLNEINDKVNDILKLTDKYAVQCLNKANQIRKYRNLHDELKEEDPQEEKGCAAIRTFQRLYSGASWADMQEEDEKHIEVDNQVSRFVGKKINPVEYHNTPILYKTLSSIYGVDIGFECEIPIVNKLNEIPSCLFWHNGDANNPSGVYICLHSGFYVRIPMPNVVDPKKNFEKTKTIKCIKGSKQHCDNTRRDMARKHGYRYTPCTYTHSGEKFKKIGTFSRCNKVPHFGNHASLKTDIDDVELCDIKTMLMHGLYDVLLGSLWFQKNKKHNRVKNMIIPDIDIAD